MTKEVKADTWMPLYITDYLGDTLHLTTEQHGAYILLIMACWKRGGSLPNDDAQLAGIAKMTPAVWRKSASILRAFFQSDGIQLYHKRVLRETEKAERLTETRRENGRLGGRPRKQTETGSFSPGSKKPQNKNLTETPSPSPTPIGVNPPNPPSGGLPHAEAFAELCRIYPTDGLGSPDKREAAWRELMAAGVDPQRIVRAALEFARSPAGKPESGRVLSLHRWLRERRWENSSGPNSAAAPSWNGPPALRAALVEAMGEDWVRGWIDAWTYVQQVPMDVSVLRVKTSFALERIQREPAVLRVLRAQGVELLLAEAAA